MTLIKVYFEVTTKFYDPYNSVLLYKLFSKLTMLFFKFCKKNDTLHKLQYIVQGYDLKVKAVYSEISDYLL